MLERTIWTFAFASGTSKTFTLNHSYKNYKLVLDNAYLPEILYSCRNQHYSSSYRSTGQHALFQSLGGDRTVTSCGKHRRIDLCCTNNRRRVNAAQVSMFRHYPDHADLPCKVPWNISQLCSPQSDLPSPNADSTEFTKRDSSVVGRTTPPCRICSSFLSMPHYESSLLLHRDWKGQSFLSSVDRTGLQQGVLTGFAQLF